MNVPPFLQSVCAWASSRPEIRSVSLVGSYARGDPSPSSDIDLVLLVEGPEIYLRDQEWASTFGEVIRSQVEHWGRVRSVRIWYADGLEVEFGFADPDWGVDLEDVATRTILEDGLRVLYSRGPTSDAATGGQMP